MSTMNQLAAGWRVKADELRRLALARPGDTVSAADAAALVARTLERCAGELEEHGANSTVQIPKPSAGEALEIFMLTEGGGA